MRRIFFICLWSVFEFYGLPAHSSESIDFSPGWQAFAPSNLVTTKRGAQSVLLNNQCFLSLKGEVFCSEKKADWLSRIDESLFNPKPVIKNAIDLVASDNQFCALLESKKVACWGVSKEIVPGSTDLPGTQDPTEVQGLSDVIRIRSKGDSTCTVLETGNVKCWGGYLSSRMNEVLSVFPDVLDLDFFGSDGCAINKNHQLFCWGSLVQPPPNATKSRNGSAFVLDDVNAVSVGSGFACVLLDKGEVRCWGKNTYGELADRTGIASTEPIPIEGIKDAISISAGKGEACAVLRSGSVKCWGSWANPLSLPYKVKGITNASRVSLAKDSSCILTKNADIICDKARRLYPTECGTSRLVIDSLPALETRIANEDPGLLTGIDKIDDRVSTGKLTNTPAAYLIALSKRETSDADRIAIFKKALWAALYLQEPEVMTLVLSKWPRGHILDQREAFEVRKSFFGFDGKLKAEDLADLFSLMGLKAREDYYLNRAEEIYKRLRDPDLTDAFYRRVYESDLDPGIRARFLLKTVKSKQGKEAALENLAIYKECVLLNSDYKAACALKLGMLYQKLKLNDLARFYLSKASPLSEP